MPLTPGTRLGPFEIVALLGAGGMGEVYRAKDTRLGRDLAIKVLPAGVAADPERLARFEAEARAASNLNHPGIVTVHDIGTEDGHPYIAMELVEGRTLRDLLAGGPIPAKRVLALAAQIADALAKAHGAGIVHRDLKPENVMVTPEGRAKLLDFGLAKAAALPGQQGTSVPTVDVATRSGTILGTVGYMSPEQAAARPVDFRSDQFSFGAVVYEMVTGRRAFSGDTAVDTLAAILHGEPEPLVALDPKTPAPLQWVVERCLAKDPEERYASTRDLARDLAQMSGHLSTVASVPPTQAALRAATPPGRSLAKAGLVLAGLVAGLLLGVAALFVRGRSPVETPPRLSRVAFSSSLEAQPAFSPDGKLLAYVTDERGSLDVVVKPLAGGEPIRVAATDADEAHPAWSPDGSTLAFCSARDHDGRLLVATGQAPITQMLDGGGGDLFLAPALGGAARKLVEDGYYPSWSPDGKRIVYQSRRAGQWDLYTISAEGGAPSQLTDDADFDYQPSWSPDGAFIAYGCGKVNEGYELCVVPAAGGRPVRLTAARTWVLRPSWSAGGGAIVYTASQNTANLWELPVAGGRASGPPRRLTLGAGQDVDAAASRDGKRVAFTATQTNGDIWELALATGTLRRVTSEASLEQHPEISPDGKTLLIESDRTGQLATWTLDLAGGFLAQVSPDTASKARWLPDGRRLVYSLGQAVVLHTLGAVSPVDTGQQGVPVSVSVSGDGKTLAFGKLASGAVTLYTIATGEAKELPPLPGALAVLDTSWSRDDSILAVNVQTKTTRELWLVPASGGPARRLTEGAFEDSHPRFSPANPDEVLFLREHRWLHTVSASTGAVRPLPFRKDGTFYVDYPSWSLDGQRVYFSIHEKTGDLYVIDR